MAYDDDNDDDLEPFDDFADPDEDIELELMVDRLFLNSSLTAIRNLPAVLRQPDASEEELLAGLAEYSQQRRARAAALRQSIAPAEKAELMNSLFASIAAATKRFGIKNTTSEYLQPVQFQRCGPDDVRVVTVADEKLVAHWDPELGHVPVRFGTECYVVDEPLDVWVTRCRMVWPQLPPLPPD